MKTLSNKVFTLAVVFLAATRVPLNAATFFGPTPYLSSADIPAGLYASGAPTFLEDFEDGTLDASIIASTGRVIPPGLDGLIDSVDADDGAIDGSGIKGHSWFTDNGTVGVKFTFPPGTTAAGLVWTDGAGAISFSAFGPGNVPLGAIGPFTGIAEANYAETTAEDRFFGVRDAAGVESILITTAGGGIELDHVQYGGVSAQNFALDWFTLDLGGGTSTGGGFAISGAITQPVADLMSGGNFSVTGEFLSLMAAVPPTETPATTPITIFDNTTGSDNGGTGATATTWLAGKFCLGSQSYQLDSVSLLLSSQDFSGAPGPPSTVRLQIYSHDPTSGKPSASTGLIMNLSGLTNPITPPPRGFGLVKWTNATPFRLSANVCYWAVLSRESGGNIGQIASFTKPTGTAGTFGTARSVDAGTTWLAARDDFTNFKMLIRGTALGTPAPTPELAADGSTAIPGGTGNFTGLPFAPGLSGNNLVFYGVGSGNQQGIYLTTRGTPTAPVRIADLKTPIPNGLGNFLSFGTEAGIIIVSGNTGVFAGTGTGGQRGIYAAVMVPPQVGSPLRIADTATAIPGGAGNFMEFPTGLSISGNNVVFAGTGSGGQRGVYAAVLVPPQVGSPLRIADTATAIPGVTGNFTEFPSAPSIRGNNAIFAGSGTGGQRGVYAAVMVPPQVGSPLRIADTAMAIPGGSGNFTEFPNSPGFSGNNAIFSGKGAGGQQGIYGARFIATAARAVAQLGLSDPGTLNENAPIAGPIFKIVDTATAIPDGTGTFTGFDAVSTTESNVAFLGAGAEGQSGIYVLTDGQLRKVISVGEAIKGKTIVGLKFSRVGLSEDGVVAFQATFSDGSQSLRTIDVPPLPAELRISGVSVSVNALRISFPASSGQSYVIESRADLASGAWSEVPGTTTTGSGAALQLILPIASTQPQQFYRVKIVP